MVEPSVIGAAMKVSSKTLKAIGDVITGDNQISAYRSGPDLVRLFNSHGASDEYKQGFPSRWRFAQDKLHHLNGSESLASLLCEILDSREFMNEGLSQHKAIDYLNQHLKHDGYTVVVENGFVKVRNLQGIHVEAKHPFEGSTEDGHAFINEQVAKMDKKVQEGDYDGAITNARSLLEAVLQHLEITLDSNAPAFDGDLPKLYKRVQRLLNLDPGQPSIDQSLKQILSGFVSIIQGFSSLSNKMADRHVRAYKPSRHHATLMCNAAKSLCSFLFDTHAFQKRGKV